MNSGLKFASLLQFRSFVMACLVMAVGLGLLPSSASAFPPSVLNNTRALQAKQRQQLVKKLQADLSTARTTLSEAQSRLAASTPELEAAKSALGTAKEREAAKEKEVQEAARSHHELEQKLLASQTAESPVVVTQKELEEAKVALDQEIHRTLNLPDHPAGFTDADRSKEQLNFTAEQKKRLKDDPAVTQATFKVDALRTHLNDQRKKLFEGDAGWKDSHARRLTLAEDLKSMESNRKAAVQEIARHAKEIKQSQGAISNAQQVIQSTSSQLTALGSAPKPPAEKK